MNRTSSTLKKQENAYRDITEQFVIDASFLWLLRSIGVNQPHYYLDDLANIEKRIDANLDGLMCNFQQAWDICLEELQYEQAGETFTAAIIAFRSRDIDKIKFIVEHGSCNEETFKGLVSAMAWLPKNLNREWIDRLLYSKSLEHKYISIALCSVLRKNPGDMVKEILTREDCLSHPKLLIRTLRLVGELKLYACANLVQNQLGHESPAVIFWANWSLIMLGEHTRVLALYDAIKEESPIQFLALQTVFKILPVDKARSLISEYSTQPDLLRTMIRSIGILGDPHAIPWLLERMNNFETAKLAGESFTLITGIDLERFELVIDEPEIDQQLPNDDEADQNVALDEDENLPFPDVNKVNHTWLRYRDRYKVGSRYIMGIEVNQNTPAVVTKLNNILKQSSQRQRHSIALTLTLLNAQSPYINTKAKGQV
ncbi:TIGR02270 family protein [Colwellia echini]|uniref:TIGR02270 family protein n=1 Tax=Colwellia echini TaxID=1982103 RepID=A0ABY3MTE8_9GAMM|nr:TIGR02270 family protein [Colwellia echini]TYK64486.1 TIGR02270 family protein [Colwellia echini]